MANIGFLNANERGSFIGKIETLAFTNVVGLRPVQSNNPNAPKYDMMARSSANSWIKIGALFEQVARTSGKFSIRDASTIPAWPSRWTLPSSATRTAVTT
jgi:uncharacterized protein (DUF736 family)